MIWMLLRYIQGSRINQNAVLSRLGRIEVEDSTPNEKKDSATYISQNTSGGTADVLLIFDEIPAHWDDMGATENGDAKDVTVTVEANVQKKVVPSEVKTPAKGEERKRRCLSCSKILFVVLGVLSVRYNNNHKPFKNSCFFMSVYCSSCWTWTSFNYFGMIDHADYHTRRIVAIALIIVTILTSIATRAYDADQSSRVAAMVLLAVTGAVSICMVIYMEVSTFKCHTRPMIGTAVVILILAIVQALIGGISVNVQPSDEAKLLKSLADSFKLAKDDVSRHYKLWAMTQYDLNCCGVYGPDDYRTQKQPYYFPPDVPISCCPAYDPDRSDLVQEREREVCKAKRTYFNNGCKDLVLLVFNETATLVLSVTIIMIVVQILLLIVGAVLKRQMKNNKSQVSPK